jgi:predicted transcriptional regulator
MSLFTRHPLVLQTAPSVGSPRRTGPVILSSVKAAISIPDDLCREIDARARSLNLSRSAFLARAAREFLESHRTVVDPTEAWNRAIERGGQPGDERGPVAARRRTKEVLRGKANDR